jgi:dTDP-4-dehydrorhamnose reductase
MIALEASREHVDVVTDQVGSPTWAAHLAQAILDLADSAAAPGIYHWTNAGQASWHEFARAIFAGIGADPERVRPTTSEAFVRPAPRPAYSVLSHERWSSAGLPAPAPWQDALTAYLASR